MAANQIVNITDRQAFVEAVTVIANQLFSVADVQHYRDSLSTTATMLFSITDSLVSAEAVDAKYTFYKAPISYFHKAINNEFTKSLNTTFYAREYAA